MWEESLIESQHAASEHRKFLTFSAAVVIHTAVILGLAASNYAGIETVNPTRIVPIFWKGAPPPKGTLEGTRREPPPRRSHQTEVRDIRPIATVPVPVANNVSLEPQQQVTEGQQANGSGEGEQFGIPEGVEGASGDWGSGLNEGTQLKEPEIESIRSGIMLPVLIRRIEPEYPRFARISRIEGLVILNAVITKEGDVQVLSVVRSDHPSLENAALEAVRQWKYRPALNNNRPVAVYFQITVKFTLK